MYLMSFIKKYYQGEETGESYKRRYLVYFPDIFIYGIMDIKRVKQ